MKEWKKKTIIFYRIYEFVFFFVYIRSLRIFDTLFSLQLVDWIYAIKCLHQCIYRQTDIVIAFGNFFLSISKRERESERAQKSERKIYFIFAWLSSCIHAMHPLRFIPFSIVADTHRFSSFHSYFGYIGTVHFEAVNNNKKTTIEWFTS